jgi:fucose 4-O-acetylase-like acetyltransferase
MEDRSTKKNNYSLELLRFILCFWVVLHHCCKYVGKFKGRFHVPTFMIMSFYFYYNSLKAKTIIKINQRFERILSTSINFWFQISSCFLLSI